MEVVSPSRSELAKMSPHHLQELRIAKELLEQPSLAVRLTDLLGTPIERALALLPSRWSEMIDRSVQTSLRKSLEFAVKSLGRRSPQRRDRFHRMAVMATGAGGGAFGLAGLLVELPLSTIIMLRTVADIARREGEDVAQISTQLACLEVFALGGTSDSDDAAETGYFAVRSALAASVTEAARHIAQRGLAESGAPALVRFLSAISTRFGIVVSEKAAAMAIPAIGAAGGAIINRLFISHFQDMARGHFTVRRLESVYGQETVRKVYALL